MEIDLDRQELAKLKILRGICSDNYRLMRLYSRFLSDTPNIVTKEMLDTLTDGTDISPQLAFSSCLSAIFGLEPDQSSDDRRFEREYLFPSVNHLDTARYRNNPYYRTVLFPEHTALGGWELKNETYPACRAFVCAGPMLMPNLREFPQIGFFTEPFTYPAVLENGNEWMTLTPVDLDTCEHEIASAHGNVVTFGLGLGYYAFMTAEKEDVTSVTVVEKSRDVIRLFETYLLPQFPHREKIRILCADALDFAANELPAGSFDFVFADTWRDVSDGLPMYLKLKKLDKCSPRITFTYWIEDMILSNLRWQIFEQIWSAAGENGHGEIPKLLPGTEIRAYEDIVTLLSDQRLQKLAPMLDPDDFIL